MHEPPHRPQDPFSRDGHDGAPVEPYASHPAPPHPTGSGRNPWKPAAIVFGSILALEVVAVVGVVVLAFFSFTDDVTSIRLDDAVADRCTAFVDAAEELPLLAGPDAAREPLEELARIADDLAATGADAVQNDADRAWVEDWDRLGEALSTLAEDPTQPFVMPTRDGTPVTVPLSLNGPLDCEPPPVITALDPDAPGTLYVDDAELW